MRIYILRLLKRTFLLTGCTLYCKGRATWVSDFDMLIVLSEVYQKIDRWICDVAWEVDFENDRVITTFQLDKEKFEHGTMSENTPEIQPTC